MLIGRPDDPHNPCRVAAVKKAFHSAWEWIAELIWAGGRAPHQQAAHTTATAPRQHFSAPTPCTTGAVHTPYIYYRIPDQSPRPASFPTVFKTFGKSWRT